MSFRDVKRLSPKVPKPREVIVRFRVTEEEYAAIEEAAEFEGARFEAELVERGLPKSVVQTLKRPSEWMRYVVMKAAAPIAEEARRERAKEAERRAREAEESKVRVARDAERALEFLITDARSALDPSINPLYDHSVFRDALAQAEAGHAALKQFSDGDAISAAVKAIEGGAALTAIKEAEQGGALAALRRAEDGGALAAIMRSLESDVPGILRKRR